MILFTKHFQTKRHWLRVTAGQHEETPPIGDHLEPEGDMSPDQRRILANEARQVLENRHFVAAFAAVHDYIESQAHSCDPDNKGKAQRIIIAKQLLQAVRREVIRKMEDGYMAEVQIVELERKKGLLRFQR